MHPGPRLEGFFLARTADAPSFPEHPSAGLPWPYLSQVMTPRISFVVFSLAACPAVASAAGKAGEVVRTFCLDCHGAAVRKGGLDLEALDAARPEAAADRWEAVVRKLHHRQMPPPGEARPSEEAYRAAVAELTGALDRAAAAAPDPGRTDTLRRLNRTEYENAVRDLLALEMEDHYLRIHTAVGSDLILMRLRDALTELSSERGLQVHRSWWVAKNAVASIERDGQKLVLTLRNGLKVPVSKTYRDQVKDAGLIA